MSDADEDIFLLYTLLAAFKPPDSSGMGHFHGLGSENSKKDALLVRTELQSPRSPSITTTNEPSLAPRYEKRNAGRRDKGNKNGRAPCGSSGSAIGSRQELRVGPIVLEYSIGSSKWNSFDRRSGCRCYPV